MGNWLSEAEFRRTEYGRLDLKEGAKNYVGPLDRAKLPAGATLVPDPKDGRFGIVKDCNGEPLCKVELVDSRGVRL